MLGLLRNPASVARSLILTFKGVLCDQALCLPFHLGHPGPDRYRLRPGRADDYARPHPAHTPPATPAPTPYPTPATLHDAANHLAEVAEQVANKVRVGLVAVEASDEVRCLTADQAAAPGVIKLERDFYATPAGRDWRGLWASFLAYNPHQEAIAEYVAAHGSEAALDYLKQLEALFEPILRAYDG